MVEMKALLCSITFLQEVRNTGPKLTVLLGHGLDLPRLLAQGFYVDVLDTRPQMLFNLCSVLHERFAKQRGLFCQGLQDVVFFQEFFRFFTQLQLLQL